MENETIESRKHSLMQKQTFIYIFLILVILLVFMPFVTTFNDVLTRIVMRLDAYKIIQNYIVPWEIRMVGVILWPFDLKPGVMGEYLTIGGNQPFLIEIAWNCVGWQSVLFFLITTLVGLQGDRYSNLSKVKALAIGFFGTFLVNLLRITGVALIAYHLGQETATIFHDYGSTVIIILWLFIFWWSAYSFVLEEKGVKYQ